MSTSSELPSNVSSMRSIIRAKLTTSSASSLTAFAFESVLSPAFLSVIKDCNVRTEPMPCGSFVVSRRSSCLKVVIAFSHVSSSNTVT